MKQNEIWLINLDPTIGAEIRNIRPAVIVNDNALAKLPLKIVVPITDWKNHYQIAPWMIKNEPSHNNGLSKLSSIDCFQIRSVSETRFVKKLGVVESLTHEQIKIGLSKVLSIS